MAIGIEGMSDCAKISTNAILKPIVPKKNITEIIVIYSKDHP